MQLLTNDRRLCVCVDKSDFLLAGLKTKLISYYFIQLAIVVITTLRIVIEIIPFQLLVCMSPIDKDKTLKDPLRAVSTVMILRFRQFKLYFFHV